MRELDWEEIWGPKNWCFWTMVLEKTLESPLDCKEIQAVHPKGDLSWVFIGRTDAKAETPVLWPPHAKSWLIGKDSDVGRDWGQEEKGTTEDEIAGWHHWLDGHESERTPGVGWWTGRPAVLRFMGSQRVGHDWATELNWMWIFLKTHSFCTDRTVILSPVGHSVKLGDVLVTTRRVLLESVGRCQRCYILQCTGLPLTTKN